MLMWVETETGVRCGVFCDECGAEIVGRGIATSDDGDLARAPLIFLHYGICSDRREARVGSQGWEDIDVFLLMLGSNFRVNWEEASERAALLTNDETGPDTEQGPRAPAGSVGTRARA